MLEKIKLIKPKGFTIIEILVVVAILAMLVTVVIIALSSSRAKARDARRESDLETIMKALIMVKDMKGNYQINGETIIDTPAWREPLTDNDFNNSWNSCCSSFLSKIPQEPKWTQNFRQYVIHTSDDYQHVVLLAEMEDANCKKCMTSEQIYNYAETVGKILTHCTPPETCWNPGSNYNYIIGN